jgi:hypothetical protein
VEICARGGVSKTCVEILQTRIQQVAWMAAPASCLCLATGADEIGFRNPLLCQRTPDNEQPTIFNLPAVGFYVRTP